jgi:hypothetical protein
MDLATNVNVVSDALKYVNGKDEKLVKDTNLILS